MHILILTAPFAYSSPKSYVCFLYTLRQRADYLELSATCPLSIYFRTNFHPLSKVNTTLLSESLFM